MRLRPPSCFDGVISAVLVGPSRRSGEENFRPAVICASPARPVGPIQSRTVWARYVYDFTEGDKDQKDLLGGKGANLAEMTKLGLPVPPGFTITTEACREYLAQGSEPGELRVQLTTALRQLEDAIGRRLGDRHDPLLVSVRSNIDDNHILAAAPETVTVASARASGPGRPSPRPAIAIDQVVDGGLILHASGPRWPNEAKAPTDHVRGHGGRRLSASMARGARSAAGPGTRRSGIGVLRSGRRPHHGPDGMVHQWPPSAIAARPRGSAVGGWFQTVHRPDSASRRAGTAMGGTRRQDSLATRLTGRTVLRRSRLAGSSIRWNRRSAANLPIPSGSWSMTVMGGVSVSAMRKSPKPISAISVRPAACSCAARY